MSMKRLVIVILRKYSNLAIFQDSSYTRNREHILRLFDEAGLEVLFDVDQEDWPKGMYRIRTFAVIMKTK